MVITVCLREVYDVLIYLFIYRLTTLSVAQTIQRQMRGLLANNELERM
jgi:hypothetical protein